MLKQFTPGLLCTVLLLAGSTLLHAQPAGTLKAFTNLRLFDGTGAATVADAVLLVRNGRIEAVGPADSVVVPDAAERIDLGGATVLPGLINVHGHAANDTEAKLALYARYGVTTVVSLGGENASHRAFRDGQDDTSLVRARFYFAGPVQEHQSAEAAVNGIGQVKAMAADWVKARVQDGSMPEAAYTALIDEAHRQQLKVAAHMYTLADSKGLVRAGVDMLAHSVRDLPVDAELLTLMTARDVCITPTLTREVSTYIYETTPDFFSDPFFLQEADPAVVARLSAPATQQRNAANAQRGKADLAMAQRNLKQLHDAGVRIALGTDSGVSAERFPGYFEHLEMQLMAEAGMAPLDIIAAATRDAAACMDLAEVGTLAVGKWADFIVLDADPLEDIANTKRLASVWIAGNRVPE